MNERFWDVRERKFIDIPRRFVGKDVFTDNQGEPRYALIGTTLDGRRLTKFVDKDYWDAFESTPA